MDGIILTPVIFYNGFVYALNYALRNFQNPNIPQALPA